MEDESTKSAADDRFKEHFASLVAALRSELHDALRAELPLALQKELPQALGRTNARHCRSLPGLVQELPGLVQDHEASQQETRNSFLDVPKRILSAPVTGSAEEESDNSDDDDALILKGGRGLMANKFNAKKVYREYDKMTEQKGQEQDQSAGKERESIAHKDLRRVAKGDDGSSRPPASQEAWQPARQLTRKSGKLADPQATELDLRIVALPSGMRGKQKQPSKINLDGMPWLQRVCFNVATRGAFTFVTILGICINAITIGVQTNWDAQNVPKETHPAFDVIEVFFCFAFLVELLLRFAAFRWAFFYMEEWRWNVFDTFLVSITLVELLVGLLAREDNNIGVNVSFMRVLRVLRLVRVVRLVRIVRLISELRTIVSSVANSLKSLAFTILIIAFLIYIMAVFLTQLVTERLRSSPDDVEAHAALSKFFDSIPIACLTLFQSMTNGIDWGEIVNPLMDHISPTLAIVYCLYISFAVFAMLNVITGVFVESALASDAVGKDADMVGRLHEFFCNWGSDGVLRWDDFHNALDDAAIQAYFQSVDLDVAEARGLFKLLDSDRSGTVEAEEFVMGCLRLKGEAKAIDLATLMYENRHWHHRLSSRLHRLEEMEKRVVEQIERWMDTLPIKAAWVNPQPGASRKF